DRVLLGSQLLLPLFFTFHHFLCHDRSLLSLVSYNRIINELGKIPHRPGPDAVRSGAGGERGESGAARPRGRPARRAGRLPAGAVPLAVLLPRGGRAAVRSR